MEKDTVFSSIIKYNGIFSFHEFYKFCYDWLKEETGFDKLIEDKYEEKIIGESKKIIVEWTCEKKITDYFRFDVKLKFNIEGLVNVEINKGGAKISTNKGSVKITMKGILVRDYEGKFERNALNKFLRSIYEKWVIVSRIREFEDKIATDCDEFLSQAKAYLALEGKK
jgi:hypothetical protein